MVSLKTVFQILRHFGPLIVEIKMAPVNPRQVDLAREERIKKLDDLIDELHEFSKERGF